MLTRWPPPDDAALVIDTPSPSTVLALKWPSKWPSQFRRSRRANSAPDLKVHDVQHDSGEQEKRDSTGLLVAPTPTTADSCDDEVRGLLSCDVSSDLSHFELASRWSPPGKLATTLSQLVPESETHKAATGFQAAQPSPPQPSSPRGRMRRQSHSWTEKDFLRMTTITEHAAATIRKTVTFGNDLCSAAEFTPTAAPPAPAPVAVLRRRLSDPAISPTLPMFCFKAPGQRSLDIHSPSSSMRPRPASPLRLAASWRSSGQHRAATPADHAQPPRSTPSRMGVTDFDALSYSDKCASYKESRRLSRRSRSEPNMRMAALEVV